MLLKTYQILVSFGDGKPVESTIEARDGILAQDLAFAKYPGARSIRILGVLSVRDLSPKRQFSFKPRPPVVVPAEIPLSKLIIEEDVQIPHPLFDEQQFTSTVTTKFKTKEVTVPIIPDVESPLTAKQLREKQMEKFTELYDSGLSLSKIAGQLDIGKTTARRWRKVLRP